MGGHDDLIRRHRPLVSHRLIAPQLGNPAVLPDGQVLGDGDQELQGVELGLAGKLHRPHRPEGQLWRLRQLGGIAQVSQGGHFPFQASPVIQGINVGVLLLKITVDIPAQFPVGVQGFQVGVEVHGRLLPAKALYQVSITQTMLGGELGRGVAGDSTCNGIGLQQEAVHPLLL